MSNTPDPFVLTSGSPTSRGVLFASPHSGRHYPDTFVTASPLDPETLRRSEDAFVDELLGKLPEAGFTTLTASYARAYIDCNREAMEIDPSMFDGPIPSIANTASERVASGFGTIPRLVGPSLEIYQQPISWDEAQRRIDAIYHPYHAALKSSLETVQAAYGSAIFVDCHSMPAFDSDNRRLTSWLSGRRTPDCVIGDRFGASCSSKVTEVVETLLQHHGLKTVRNRPYAGGYCTRHYGRPHQGVHAIQIEFARDLYMRAGFEPDADALKQLQAVMADIAENLASQLGDTAAAAE